MKLSLKPSAAFGKGIHPKRFWEQVEYNPKTGCWEWQGYVIAEGRYGRFMAMGHKILCHRYAYQQLVGIIPEGMQVCHRCDNPICVRPEHLFLGTNSDNQKDSITKGRHNTVKITPEEAGQILAMLAAGASTRTITRQLGVSASIIGNIKNNGTWGWLIKEERENAK